MSSKDFICARCGKVLTECKCGDPNSIKIAVGEFRELVDPRHLVTESYADTLDRIWTLLRPGAPPWCYAGQVLTAVEALVETGAGKNPAPDV